MQEGPFVPGCVARDDGCTWDHRRHGQDLDVPANPYPLAHQSHLHVSVTVQVPYSQVVQPSQGPLIP